MTRARLLVVALWAAPRLPSRPSTSPPSETRRLSEACEKAKAQVRPAWAELTAEQQQILAPLKVDWESLDPERRRE